MIDKREYMARQAEVGAVYRRVLGRHFPAMSLIIVAGLLEDQALLEIEATAYLGPQACQMLQVDGNGPAGSWGP